METFKCKFCGKDLTKKGYGHHLKSCHDVSQEEFYNNENPSADTACKICGCKAKFKNIYEGYAPTCGTPRCRSKYVALMMSDSDKIVKEARRQQTCYAKYGGLFSPNAFTDEALQKKKDSYIKTCLDKYGTTNYFSSGEGIAKVAEVTLERYGKKNYNGIDKYKNDRVKMAAIKEKEIATKKANGTLNSSKQEDLVYEMLCNKYGASDVAKQHKDDRYPYYCDFYVKSKDLFIECNFHWTHGKKPYTGSITDLIQVVRWRRKNTEYFDNAINTWTARDVHKIKAAIDNDLNYKLYYTFEEVLLDYAN